MPTAAPSSIRHIIRRRRAPHHDHLSLLIALPDQIPCLLRHPALQDLVAAFCDPDGLILGISDRKVPPADTRLSPYRHPDPLRPDRLKGYEFDPEIEPNACAGPSAEQ